jgi:hypothetical protein
MKKRSVPRHDAAIAVQVRILDRQTPPVVIAEGAGRLSELSLRGARLELPRGSMGQLSEQSSVGLVCELRGTFGESNYELSSLIRWVRDHQQTLSVGIEYTRDGSDLPQALLLAVVDERGHQVARKQQNVTRLVAGLAVIFAAVWLKSLWNPSVVVVAPVASETARPAQVKRPTVMHESAEAENPLVHAETQQLTKKPPEVITRLPTLDELPQVPMTPWAPVDLGRPIPDLAVSDVVVDETSLAVTLQLKAEQVFSPKVRIAFVDANNHIVPGCGTRTLRPIPGNQTPIRVECGPTGAFAHPVRVIVE